MDITPELLSMPLEVLTYIGHFLSPRPLTDLSGTCQCFRTAINSNSIWRRFSHGAHISRLLDDTTSVVEPRFTDLATNTLDPLCDHRLHFIKQSRLLCNFRQGRYVDHSIDFEGFLYDFETSRRSWDGQMTYKSDYLFTICEHMDEESSDNPEPSEIIKVYNIKEEPQLVTTLRFENHTNNDYSIIIWARVVGDKLVVRKDDWFDFYKIKLPSVELPLLYSVNMNESGNSDLNNAIILNNYLVVENLSLLVLHVLNVHSRETFDIKRPRVGHLLDLKILNCMHEDNLNLILISFQTHRFAFELYLYNINTQEYTSFHVHCNDFSLSHGVVGDGHVALLGRDIIHKQDLISIYDCETSTLLVQSTDINARYYDCVNIINHCVVIPSEVSVQVFKLSDLTMDYELQYDSGEGLYELPNRYLRYVDYIKLPGLGNFIIISTNDDSEVWDFDEKRKLFKLPHNDCVAINDSFSKIICNSNTESALTVLSFW